MRKSYFAQFSRKFWFLRISLFPAIPDNNLIIVHMNKIQQLWKNSPHCTKKIQFSFVIFESYKHVFMRKIMENLWLILYSCVISCKNDFFRMNAQFCAKLVMNWYRIDAKYRAKKIISCKNTKSLGKGIYCFVEEPSDGQKPP